MIERRTIGLREQWLRWRHQDVTASVAAALLDAHPYVTRLGLYAAKTAADPAPVPDSPQMRRGRHMERVAVEMLREDHPHPGWTVVGPVNAYYRDPELRIGCTPDVIVIDEDRRRGVVEIKSVEPGVFERSWRDENGGISPPAHAAVQAIVCRHLCEAEWCAVAPIRVGHGIDLDLVRVEEPPGLWDRLLEATAEFWRMVERGEPPEPTFPADTETVLRMHRTVEPGSVIDLSGDNGVLELRDRDAELALVERAACEERRSIKAQLAARMAGAEVATFNGATIATAKSITRKAYSVPENTFREFRWKKGAT